MLRVYVIAKECNHLCIKKGVWYLLTSRFRGLGQRDREDKRRRKQERGRFKEQCSMSFNIFNDCETEYMACCVTHVVHVQQRGVSRKFHIIIDQNTWHKTSDDSSIFIWQKWKCSRDAWHWKCDKRISNFQNYMHMCMPAITPMVHVSMEAPVHIYACTHTGLPRYAKKKKITSECICKYNLECHTF